MTESIMRAVFDFIITYLRPVSEWLRRSRWLEVPLLLLLFVLLAWTYLFVKLANVVLAGETQDFDEWALRWLRRPDALEIPIGPEWLADAALDATALGSPLLLGLLVAAVVGFLTLHRQLRMAGLTAVMVAGGGLLSLLLKDIIGRGRPTVVPHLRDVGTASFPSGHAMLSAVVYLTLAILVMQVVHGRWVRFYCLGWALLLAFLVGVSRVYLGVHYPTDVLAGWMAGIAWALVGWLLTRTIRHGSVKVIARAE
jgi:undecaprenyl-diphosphatase